MPSTGAGHRGGSAKGHTPGAVKDPEHDARLKENRDKAELTKSMGEKGPTPKSAHKSASEGHTPGAVKSPDDGRLKENRHKGIHKGDA